MVDFTDRCWVSSYSMDSVPAGHVRSSCCAAVVLVGAGHHLVFRPDRVVLGHSSIEAMPMAPGVGGSLADPMVTTAEKTSWYPVNGSSSQTTGLIEQIPDPRIGGTGTDDGNAVLLGIRSDYGK